MTARTAAIGIIVLLVAAFLVRQFGTFAECFVTIWSGSLSGFIPNGAIAAECFNRTFEFPFSLL